MCYLQNKILISDLNVNLLDFVLFCCGGGGCDGGGVCFCVNAKIFSLIVILQKVFILFTEKKS